MAAANPIDIIRVPGKLVANPTNLSAAYPYSGTEIGVTRDQEYRIGAQYHEEKAEEWGGATNRVLYAGQRGVFACVLRSWDSAAWTLVFPESAAGTVSRRTGASGDVNDSSLRAGRFLSGSVLLWVPQAVTAHPALIVYNALPMLDEAAKLQMALNVELTAAAIFAAAPDSSGRTYKCAPLADISL